VSRYHFDIHTDKEVYEDFNGESFPSFDSAESIARRSIVEIISEQLHHKVSTMDWSMRIRDGEGRTILTLAFIDVLKSP